MALPTRPNSSWMRDFDLPSQLFGTGSDDFELYEDDGEFVLSVELPGFDPEEIDVRWDDGQLYVAAEHTDEEVGRTRQYSRRFRFPREVDSDDIAASYENGVLEVTLPVATDAVLAGEQIPIES
jgi:HSP20 family protein